VTATQRAAILAEVRNLTNHGQHQAANALWLRYFKPLNAR